MNYWKKTKAQLVEELEALRKKVEELESGKDYSKTYETIMGTKAETFSLPEREGDDLPELADIIDVQSIQSLMNNFYDLTHIPMSITDLKGNVLVGVGWQDICTKFHRVHPETCKNCIESDIELSAGVFEGEYKLYKCKNNMWDVSTPIMVGGRHMGNVFSGQFFFDDEQIDYELFRLQAAKYGFAEREYLLALEDVQRLSRKSLNAGMAFFVKLAQMVSRLSYSNVELNRSLAERVALMDSLRATKQDIRGIFENSSLGIYRTTPSGRFINANPALARIYGYDSPKELMECVTHVGKQLYADPEAREQWISLIEKHNFAIYEAQMRRKDGSTCWVRQRAQAVRDLEGNTIYYEGFTEDITEQKQAQEELKQYRDNLEALVEERTKQLEEKNRLLISEIAERKKAEEALRESENTYRTIFENTGNATLFYGEDALITLVNNEYLKMFQFTREEVEGKKRWVDLVLKEDLEWLTEYHRLRGIDSKAVPRNYELRVVDRYGNIKNVYMTIAMIPGTQKRVASILDITPLKEAEKELKKYLEEISDLYENAPCGYHSLGADGTFIRINKTELAWLGYAREEIIGKMKLPDLLTKEERETFWQKFSIFKKRGWASNQEYNLIRKDGSILPVLINATAVFDENGNFLISRGSLFDNTERKRVENALIENEALYRNLFENAAIGMFQSSLEGRFMRINKAFATMLGYESQEEVISSITDTATQIHADPRNRAELLSALKRQDWFYAEQPYFRKDGSIMTGKISIRRVLNSDGDVAYLEGIVEDITERKKAEEDLQERERELQIKAKNLEEVNTTLKVLLNTLENDKTELEGKVLVNIKDQVFPYLDKLKKTSPTEEQLGYINAVKERLHDLFSPFIHDLTSRYLDLTPKELLVASLIKEGKSTKEIEAHLNMTSRTVCFHRENLRKKLGLNKTKVNLQTFLMFLSKKDK